MIRIDELRVTADAKNVIIRASVRDLPYYKNVHISSIKVDNQDTYKDGGPSSDAYGVPLVETEDIDDTNFNPNGEDTWIYKDILEKDKYYSFKVEDEFTYEFSNYAGDLQYSFDYGGKYLNSHIFQFNGEDLIEYNPKEINIVVDYRNFPYNLEKDLLFVYIKAEGTPTSDTPCGMDNEYTLGVTFNACLLYSTFMNSIKQVEKECEIPKDFINYFLRFKAIELGIETGNYMQAIQYYNKFIADKIKLLPSKDCNCYG